jgi:predicted Zn finger-like uncharacterized protein
MRIACSRCQTNYEVPDDKLSRGAVKVRCSKCGHTFAVRTRPTSEESEPPFPSLDQAGSSGPGAGLGRAGGSDSEEAPSTPQEARFEDFDFGSFQEPPGAGPGESEAEEAGAGLGEAPLEGLQDNSVPPAGGLDLREFGDLDKNIDLRGDSVPGVGDAPVERVREDEVVSSRRREAAAPPSGQAAPRLDIQRGPRLPERDAKASPVMARDRRRSPLFWAVVLVGAVVLAYTGYNLYFHREEAFQYFNPEKVRALWQSRQMEARLAVEDLTGYYPDLPGGRRAFVIRGEVVNRSTNPQSLIRVQATLYGADGNPVATKDVYSGNVLSDSDVATLSEEAIESRLQNEVGDAMTNMEVPPGGRVPFTVVFPTPPDGVEKFSAKAVHAKSGAAK